MGYVDNNLITGETVTYRGRLHWILFAKPSLVSFLIIAVVGLLFYAFDFHKVISTGAVMLTWLIVLIIAVFPILMAALTWNSAEFSITNKRVILKSGFIQSKTAEMFLNKIESVGVDQTIMGRIMGYGDIVIRGTGGSLEPFRRISGPLEFRKQIQQQIGKSFEPLTKATPRD